jgi:hypothetical protein
MRVEFDFSLEDVVDLNHRAMNRSKAVRSIRSRAIWIPAVISGPVLLATWIVVSGSGPGSAGMWAVGLGVAVAFSILNYYFWRWNYDWSVSRRIRRLVREQLAKAQSMRCTIELRPTGVWALQDGTEILHSWSDLEEVIDSADDLELRFRNGFVIARNRGFSSPDQRAEFFAAVTDKLAASPTPQSSS